MSASYWLFTSSIHTPTTRSPESWPPDKLDGVQGLAPGIGLENLALDDLVRLGLLATWGTSYQGTN